MITINFIVLTMKFISQNPKFLLTLFQVIENVNSIITLKCKKDGLSIQCMNTCHTAIIDCKLKADIFMEFSVTKDVSIGIELRHICKILDLMDVNDFVEFSNSDDCLTITRHNKTKKSLFKLRLLEVTDFQFELPIVEKNDLHIKILMNRFINDCKEMELLNAETFTIVNNQKDISFTGVGEFGDTTIDINKKTDIDESLLENNKSQDSSTKKKSKIIKSDYQIINNNNSIDLTFSLQYFSYIFKMSNITSYLNLKINNNFPIKMEFFSNNKNHYLHYYVAPKCH